MNTGSCTQLLPSAHFQKDEMFKSIHEFKLRYFINFRAFEMCVFQHGHLNRPLHHTDDIIRQIGPFQFQNEETLKFIMDTADRDSCSAWETGQ